MVKNWEAEFLKHGVVMKLCANNYMDLARQGQDEKNSCAKWLVFYSKDKHPSHEKWMEFEVVNHGTPPFGGRSINFEEANLRTY